MYNIHVYYTYYIHRSRAISYIYIARDLYINIVYIYTGLVLYETCAIHIMYVLSCMYICLVLYLYMIKHETYIYRAMSYVYIARDLCIYISYIHIVYIYTNIYIYICIYTYIHVYAYVFMHTLTCTKSVQKPGRAHKQTSTNIVYESPTHTQTHARAHVHTHTHAHYVYTYV